MCIRDRYKANPQQVLLSHSHQELWNMKYALISNINLETETPVHILGRWSSFVPANIPMVIGMSILPPTMFNTMFWQSANQVYNFWVNYCNRSSSKPLENKDLAISFFGAIGSAVSVSLTAKTLIDKIQMSPTAKIYFSRFGGYLGASSASLFNLYFARLNELKVGIQLKDPETGEYIENLRSKKAAERSLLETSVSRVLIPIPIFFVPSFLLNQIKKKGLLPKGKIGNTILNATIAAALLGSAMPLALAVFPQYSKIRASDLEPEFQDLVNSKGNKISEFIYNRGL
eukprot:TRINITY_DN9920_c0_g2_i1.p1 TRINITY_DN9920_c0_g2~~TRINITY_DN9920_c0_g2_i1.p1  ORF type:complete len:287 (-),score=28.28 TRINITY_DN9920_c0_g2_i1:84-944(-)